jgi:hypothetical protein
MSIEIPPLSKAGLDFMRWKIEHEKNPKAKYCFVYEGSTPILGPVNGKSDPR